MGNAWDVTPWPERGNASPDEIFRAVGKAMASWELVEQAIASVFTVVTVGGYYATGAPAVRSIWFDSKF
jgi:hypothetical protein